MIESKKQNWNIGSKVKIGFIHLVVVSVKSEIDGLPDIYTLASLDGKKLYQFIPHNGLTKLKTKE